MTRSAFRLLPVALAALAIAGCGLGPGEGPRDVRLVVTRDFGARTVGAARVAEVPGEQTVMRFLQRRFDVRTRYGGGFVQAIDGLSGGRQAGEPVDWFYYVNGIDPRKGAAAIRLHPGDRVWWDRHDWRATISIPAVVGSFPEPFRSGTGGERLPVRVDCAPGSDAACAEVRRRMDAAGVSTAQAKLGAGAGRETLRLVVGPWAAVRRDPGAGKLERGPATSGVYARPAVDGRTIATLGPDGRPASVLGAGTGLVAATRYREAQPTWVVTGTDARGVLTAARSLTERTLVNRFAVALPGGRAVSLPEAR